MGDLKLYARISKQSIKTLFKTFRTRTEYTKVEDNSACSKCPVNELLFLSPEKTLEREEYCKHSCSFKTTKLETLYHSIDKETEFGLFEVISSGKMNLNLSKSCLKQYILYHFLPANKYLVRKAVSFTYIAKQCKISVPTARLNHKKLVQAGLVYSTKNANLMDIVIDGEHGLYQWETEEIQNDPSLCDTVINFLDEDNSNKKNNNDDKYAYTTFSLEQLKHLINIKDVNILKVELKRILWADASTGMKDKSNLDITLNKDNLLIPLPEYVKKSKRKVKEILNSKKSKYKLEGCRLDTSNFKRPNKIRESIKSKFFNHIENLFDKNHQPFSKNYAAKKDEIIRLLASANPNNPFIQEDLYSLESELELEATYIINNFIDLSAQFGIKKTMDAIKTMFQEHSYLNNETGTIHTDINNPGAYVRSRLISNINKGCASNT